MTLQTENSCTVPSRAPVKKRKQWSLTLQHTLDHRECPACESVNARLLSIDSAISTLSVLAAGERFIEWRRPYVRQGSIDSYVKWVAALHRFFGSLRLEEITAGHIREYQRMRQVNADQLWKRTAGHSAINHEINTLSQILEYAGLWQKIKPYYHPISTPRWSPPRVLEAEEEKHLFETAASDPELELAYLVALITNNTSAAGVELRHLRVMNVKLTATLPEVFIPAEMVKTEMRGRRIPLNPTAAYAFERCLQRAAKLGSFNREHYLFPFRVNRGLYDPNRPASRYWLRANWNKLRDKSGIKWLRPHDIRHQAITRMLESGAPEQSVKSVAGHVSQQMLEHYSHTRMAAKLAVVTAIEPRDFRIQDYRRA